MLVNCSGREIYLFEYMDMVNSTDITSPISLLFYALELLLILTSLLLVFLVTYLNFNDPVWHKNLQYLMGYFFLGSVPSHFARIIFIWYELVKDIREDACDSTLVLSTVFRLQYGFAIMHAAMALILERAAAFYFLRDYEKKRRVYISATILILQIGLSALTTLYNIFDSVSFQALFIYMSILASVSIVSFCALWQANLHKFRRIGISARVKDYSLSKRFQLTENIRAFQSIRNMEIGCVIMLFIVGAAGYFMVHGANTVLGVHLFELLVSCSSLILCSTILLSSQKWRQFVMVRIQGGTVSLQVKKVGANEGEVYFDQLNRDWNQRPT